MTRRILLVDDEPNVLSGLRRQLRSYEVTTAEGPEKGLEALAGENGFAVIVSDFKMPGMNGVAFLARAMEIQPDAVRMMLTGQADMDDAIEAINEGRIFRFLTKPCAPDRLTRALDDGLEQHRLVLAERQLLENTLAGSVRVLTEALSLVNSEAFSRSSRIARIVGLLCERMGLSPRWQFEMAGMLSQLGCITLPRDSLARLAAGQELSDDEQRLYDEHPRVGAALLARIPRMEPVARMIAWQGRSLPDLIASEGIAANDPVAIGSQLVKVAVAYDARLRTAASAADALEALAADPVTYPAAVVEQLSGLDLGASVAVRRTCRVDELRSGMIVDEDVEACNGLLLVRRGAEVTVPVIERFRGFARGIGVREPFRVIVDRDEAGSTEACVREMLAGAGEP